jgi:hypothetical protein
MKTVENIIAFIWENKVAFIVENIVSFIVENKIAFIVQIYIYIAKYSDIYGTTFTFIAAILYRWLGKESEGIPMTKGTGHRSCISKVRGLVRGNFLV